MTAESGNGSKQTPEEALAAAEARANRLEQENQALRLRIAKLEKDMIQIQRAALGAAGRRG